MRTETVGALASLGVDVMSNRLPRTLRRNGAVILIVTILAIAGAAVLAAVQQPVYSATSKVFVSTGAASSITDLNQSTSFTQQVVKSYVDVATTPYVLTPVIDSLGLSLTPAQLASQVTASAPIGTVVIEITAVAASPIQAASIANAISNRLGAAVVNLSPATTSAASASVTITPLQSAVASNRPTSPNTLLVLVIGAILGVVLGIVLALIRDRLDTRVRSLDDVVRATGASVIGTVDVPTDGKDRCLTGDRSLGRNGEVFRTVKAHLALHDDHGPSCSIVVTSSSPREGSSFTAVNLAASIAASGLRVLLVDANLQNLALSNLLGLASEGGLTDVLSGAVRLPAALRVVGSPEVQVLPAGSASPNSSELLQTRALPELMERLAQTFDIVVYDAPDLGSSVDAAVLAKHASGVLFVCAIDRAAVVEVADTVVELDNLGATVLGVVATAERRSRRRGISGLGRRSRRGIEVGGTGVSLPIAD